MGTRSTSLSLWERRLKSAFVHPFCMSALTLSDSRSATDSEARWLGPGLGCCTSDRRRPEESVG